MNKVTREKNRDFTTISNVFLRDKNLSLKSKGFLAVIMGLPDDWDFSINGICSILKEGKTSVYSTIKELVQYRYCNVVQQRKADGTIAGTDYSFFEIPYNEVPQQDYPYSENPNMDNQPQLNTNNNKELKEQNTEVIKSKEKFDFRSAIISLGVEENICDDWLQVRKSKRASNTETAFKAIEKEVMTSGLSANDCIRIAAENSWQGFKVEWLINKRNGQAINSVSNDKQQRMQGYANTLHGMLSEVERNRANGKFGHGADDEKLCW